MLPPAFLEELRNRTAMPALVGRTVRLTRSGRQWKGCCPFHGERTPSFYVYDDHFHCFGCGAHGDAIAFVMQSAGSSFPEAVEHLAAEAGLQVPKATPEAAEAERRRLDLARVMDLVEAAFRRRLFLPEGAPALAYLEGRGLTRDTIARWGLGWSGPGRGALAADLTREGVTIPDLVAGGLLRRDDDGRVSDLFFNRVTFPIRDARGRIVSFGGRVLGDGQPKYINGPETEIFTKRRTLYGLHAAREARQAAVLVVEGYMDVIALHQAGFTGAVAPLGTALTEEQLGLLWRASPVPILCFDGDAAGRRAAARVLDVALPSVAIDRGLSFLFLPTGQDPDSLIRTEGPDAMAAAIAAAEPLSRAGYVLLGQAGPHDTAEQRAAFRARLVAAAGTIQDTALRSEVRRAWLARFLQGDRPAPPCDDAPCGEPERLFSRCRTEWAAATEAAIGRIAAMTGADRGDLEGLVAAAPVWCDGGRIDVITDRKPRARDWRVLLAVRDGAPAPDYSDAGLADTAARSVREGRIVDVLACDRDLMTVTARLVGATAVLGWPQDPELAVGPVRLSANPNAWLRGGARGAVLIGDDVQIQDWLLRCPAGVSTGSLLHGRAVETKFHRAGVQRPKVFVRERIVA